MKTSNKILLSTLLAIFLIFIGIHIALYAKYKSGDFTVATDDFMSNDTTTLKPVRFVKVTGMDNLVIVPSSGFAITKQKKMPGYFKYAEVGDTLFITGDTSTYRNNNELVKRRMHETVWLHLPSIEMISAENTAIHLLGARDSAAAINTNVLLSSASLFVQPQAADTTMFFGKLSVQARDGSEFIFSDNPSNVSQVACELRNSKIQDAPSASIGTLSIRADQQSTVQLNGNNLRKLTSITP